MSSPKSFTQPRGIIPCGQDVKSKFLPTKPTNITNVRVTNLDAFRKADLMCNYVPIFKTGEKELQMYRLDFEPKVESAELMRQLFRQSSMKIFQRRPIYDGVHECRSGEKLMDKVTKVKVTDERKSLDGTSSATTSEASSYEVTFTHTGSTLMDSQLLRTYNIHMKRFFNLLGYFQAQPGLMVHPGQSFSVGDGIKILRGFRTSAGLFDQNQLFMNFEGSHKLIQQRNVLEMMQQIRQNSRNSASSSGDFREQIRSELVGKLVVTSYNKRAYRIEDIDFDQNPKSNFLRSDGSQTSYFEYFNVTYNYLIRDQAQPLLSVIPSNNRHRGEEEQSTQQIYLVPEMCNVAGLIGQQANDNRLKMQLIKASQIAPQERVNQLRSFLKSLHDNEEVQAQLKEWAYDYATDGLKLQAHVLQPTKIGTGQLAARGSTDAWPSSNAETGDFNVNELAVTPVIGKMVIIFGRSDLPLKGKISFALRQGFDRINLRVNSVETIDLNGGDHASLYTQRLKSLHGQGVTLAVVVLHGQNKTCYDAVKKAATGEMGMITQVVTARLLTDDRKARSAATKIAIQIAAKIGGEPWWVDIPMKGAMVCGYDTHHDTTNRGRSFGAFLASMNDRYSRWFSRADQHDKLDEMSSQISLNVLEALRQYQRMNGKLPQRIIIYRDGVGEGQVEHVFKVELKMIIEKLASIADSSGEQTNRIRLTMVLVNKRVGARFYMRNIDDKYANPPPGTVIDHEVTLDNRFDFYLISQSTRQGTISPTYYNVIHDEANFPPDVHQRLAYKLSLLYYNWTGTVRVPAPCQYAHKLAQLCGEHMHCQPNASLSDRLHFL